MKRMYKAIALLLAVEVILAVILVAVMRPKPAADFRPNDELCGQGEGCNISNKRVQGFSVGNQIPNIELTTFEGETTLLYEMLDGKDKFILSLAVDWCSDCERQDQKLDEYYSKLPDNYGAAVVFVDYTSSDGTKTTNKKQAQQYVSEKDYSFPYFWDENNQIANKFGGVLATPTNILLDEDAIIKAKTEEIDMDILFATNQEQYDPEITREK